MAVARGAAQDAVSHSVTLSSNGPLADHSATPEAPSAEEEEYPNNLESLTKQVAAKPAEGSGTGISIAVVGVDKRIVMDIKADASSAASHNFDRR